MSKLSVMAAFAATMGFLAAAPAAEAVVYCKYVGVPKGCVAKPGVVLAPAPGAAVRAATPGVGAPGVGVAPGAGVGAPGVGVGAGRVGTPNAGGPVNRIGVR